MPIYLYECPDHGQFEKRAPMAAGKVSYGPCGERKATGGFDPNKTAACPECERDCSRLIGRTRTFLRADGTQNSGWTAPGMSGIDYRNGPEGTAASHLKGLDGGRAF